MEPLTSLMIRELRILGAEFGRASRGCNEMARALREHLQPEVAYATYKRTKGKSGADAPQLSLPGSSSDDPFGPNLNEDYD